MMNEIYPWLTPQWQQLMALRQNKRMPHALLFTGVSGLGKTSLAHALGHALLCKQPMNDKNMGDQNTAGTEANNGKACGHCSSCQLLAADTHPDYYHIKPLPPEKSKSKKPVLSIRIDAIRELCSKLSQTSQMGGYRIAIIEQADMMNVASANSLLKTLEEPGDNTLLILLSANPNRLPVTIRSRCQQLKIATPEFSQVETWLQEKGEFTNAEQCLAAFSLAHQAPLAALSVVEETEQRTLLASALLARFNRENVLDYSLKLSQGDKQQLLVWMLDWVNDLVYLSTAASSANEHHSRLVNRENQQQLSQLAQRVNRVRLFDLQSQILQTLQQGAIALNPQLLWENLLLSWDRL